MKDSETLNKEYSLLEQQRLRNPSDPKIELKIKKIEKECNKLIKKKLKAGDALKGRLENLIINQQKALRTERAHWARKRGRNFQIEVVQLLTSIGKKLQQRMVVQLNKVNKYAFQPYDVALFSAKSRPIFFECKSGGVKMTDKGLCVCSNNRRYTNYQSKKDRIENFFYNSGSELYYCYNDTDKIWLVRAKVINPSVIKTRNLYLPLSSQGIQWWMINKDLEQLSSFTSFLLFNQQLRDQGFQDTLDTEGS